MQTRNESEVVVITGASAGVGRATVRAFARRGAAIGLVARGKDGLEAAKQEVIAAGGRPLVFPVDVANASAVEAVAEAVERELGPIDVWINNAMVTVFSPVSQMTAEDYRRVTEVTYLGYVYGTLAALKRMLPRNSGMIIQVGSALSYRAIPLQSAYCAAKHAVEGFTESLRTELIHDGNRVKVSMVQLPAINTPQHNWSKSRMPRRAQPVPPLYQPELAAEAIYHAAHHYRREWTLGTITDLVLLGNKIMPGFGDWYLAKTGYESQLTVEPEDPKRAHNLWQPLPGDHGARGRFSDEAHATSIQWWLTTHRRWLGIAGIALAGFACALMAPSSARRSTGIRAVI
jgi:NAD(P)-dependent dehydrogenase (short-subunit alcohol dehydrogenase family)